MATKKAKKTEATPEALAAKAKTATAADAKEDAILACIVKIFTDLGFPHISALDVKIVWASFNDPNDIIDQLGDGIRDCIIGKGFHCQGLAGLFQIYHDTNKLTTLAQLIAILKKLVTP